MTTRGLARIIVCLLIPTVAAILARPTSAYQFIEFAGNGGQTLRLSWDDTQPVDYFVNNTRPRDFSLQQSIDTINTSFQTWENVESANIRFNFRGTTQAEPFVFFDFISTLGFVNDPELQGTGILGATSWIINTNTGEIAESDIFFNNDFPWSLNPAPGSFDFQSVVTHEIGHFFGLGHSSVGIMETEGGSRRLLSTSAIMFPFAFESGSTEGRVLTRDDEIGVSVLYPAGDFTSRTGALQGRVTKGGQGVGFAHLVAVNPFTGEMIGFFADESGGFDFRGLSPGPQVVRVGPILDPTSPEDFAFPENLIDLNFSETVFTGRATVTPGGETGGIDIEVNP